MLVLICFLDIVRTFESVVRGGSRAGATSKVDRFVITVNGWKPLTIITKRSILDVAAALDQPLTVVWNMQSVCLDGKR